MLAACVFDPTKFQGFLLCVRRHQQRCVEKTMMAVIAGTLQQQQLAGLYPFVGLFLDRLILFHLLVFHWHCTALFNFLHRYFPSFSILRGRLIFGTIQCTARDKKTDTADFILLHKHSRRI